MISAPHDPRVRAFVVVLRALLLGLVVACASTPTNSAERLRVTFRDYTIDRHFELASESHTDRVSYYSQVRDDAARKIQHDGVMRALTNELERQGYKRHAQEGNAPRQSGGILRGSLQIEDGEHTSHWVVGRGTDAQERIDFNTCMQTFFELYNASQGLQAVDNDRGPAFFEEPPTRPRRR